MTTACAAADATAPPQFAASAPPLPSLPPMPDHFSYSAMTTFQDPRRWSYRYLRRAAPECVSSSLLMGGAVHAVLAHIHRRRMAGEPDDLGGAMDAFDIHWLTQEAGKEVLYAKGEDAAGLRREAETLIRLYLAGTVTGGRILAVERLVRLELPGMSVPVTGRTDWLAETEDALLVVESKTSRPAFSTDKRAEAAGQLALYAAALCAEALAPLAGMLGAAGKPVRGRVVVFRRLKRLRIETYDVPLTVADAARMRGRLAETWSLAVSAHAAGAFPARPSWQCRTCPYRRRCAAETGGAHAPTRPATPTSPAE